MNNLTTIAEPRPASRAQDAVRTKAAVALDHIRLDAYFLFREGGIDHDHKADLATTIKNSGQPLDPVVLWQPEGEPNDGLLTVLDGAHRVAAYGAANWTGAVPAILVTCHRRMALQIALQANARNVKPLSKTERMDAAWRLVREHVSPRFKVEEIARAANVGKRTVDNMRARFRVMHEEKIEITGQWWRDQVTRDDGQNPMGQMSDAQRKAAIESVGREIREVFDWRKRPELPILRDSQAMDEAVLWALGEHRVRAMCDFLFNNEEEADMWAEARAMTSVDYEAGEAEAPDDNPMF